MIGVILNPRSGFVVHHGLQSMHSIIKSTLPEAQIRVLTSGSDVGTLCAQLIADGAECIAAAGGDGTMNAVAAHLVNTQVALGIIPAGTLNHFARDVGVGRAMQEALHVLTKGYTLPVDVATVNGRIFLNNSSIGLYARMVEIRRRYEQRLGKWRAMLHASLLVARHAETSVVSIASNGASEEVHSYLVFVGNNQYELDLLHLGQRASLDAGELCCFIVEGPTRLGLIRHVFGFFRDHGTEHLDIRSICTSELTIAPSRRHVVEVALDGEVIPMTTPLLYRVLPRALRVVVPKPPPMESREARDATDEELRKAQAG